MLVICDCLGDEKKKVHKGSSTFIDCITDITWFMNLKMVDSTTKASVHILSAIVVFRCSPLVISKTKNKGVELNDETVIDVLHKINTPTPNFLSTPTTALSLVYGVSYHR